MDTARRPKTHRAQIATASGLNVLAGAWLIAAPFVLDYEEVIPSGNDIVVGSLIVLIGAIKALIAPRAWGLSSVNILLGLWLLAAPLVLSYDDTLAVRNDRCLGVVIVLLASWSTVASATTRQPQKQADPTG